MSKVKEPALGLELRDVVTGFQGIATSKIEYLNGCVQYCVKPKMKPDSSKMPTGEYIDVQRLIVCGPGVTDQDIKDPDGPGGPDRRESSEGPPE